MTRKRARVTARKRMTGPQSLAKKNPTSGRTRKSQIYPSVFSQNLNFFARMPSLLLAAAGGLLLPLTRDDLAQHHDAIPVHEGDARQALAILEGVTHQWLLRLKLALGHLVRLQR